MRLRDEAVEDILIAVTWYETQREDLGLEFTDELDLTLERIADGPEKYSIQYRDIRRALLRRFPYAVYFLLQSNTIQVLAVLHQHQQPAEWRGRVDR